MGPIFCCLQSPCDICLPSVSVEILHPVLGGLKPDGWLVWMHRPLQHCRLAHRHGPQDTPQIIDDTLEERLHFYYAAPSSGIATIPFSWHNGWRRHVSS